MINNLKRTQPLRPSKIGQFLKCPLRYVFETERPNVPKLNSNPYVYLGISFHNSIEKYWGNHLISAKEIRNWIKDEFQRQVQKDLANVTKWLLEKYSTDSLITQSLINDTTRLAYQQIRNGPSILPTSAERNETIDLKSSNIEQRIINEDLDIAGRADLIEIAKDSVTVVDFKLGLSISEDGQPDPVYVMQLATYALALLDQNPDKNFHLELRSPKRTISIEFSRQLKLEVSKLVERMKEVLPKNQLLTVEDLSTPGEYCKKCNYRPSCPSYIERLKIEGKKINNFISDFDVYGEVQSVKSEDDLYSIEVYESISNNKIQILRLPKSLVKEEIKKGEKIYFFDLSTPEVIGKGIFIANFQVVNDQDIANSAFSFALKRELDINA